MTRHRRPWNEAEDQQLRALIVARRPAGEIARELGRTVDAIRGRAAHLGLLIPSTLRPWREAMRRPGQH